MHTRFKNTSMWQMALLSNLCHRLSWHVQEKKKKETKTENKTTTKKCAAASTWWIGVFLLQPAPQKTKACRMFMESEPPWRFSMQELWTFSWGGCRGIQEEGGKNPLSLKKKKKRKKSHRFLMYINMRHHQPESCRVTHQNKLILLL